MKNEDIEKLDFEGWPLPNEFLIEIGRVSVLWVALENFLGVCIGKLAGFDEILDPKPFILVTHSTFPQKLDILSALCAHLCLSYPNLKGHIDTISKLKSAQKARNKFLHNTIGPDPSTGKMQLAQGSARGKIKSSLDPVSIADIRKASIEIDEALASLYKLILRVDIGPAWKRRQAEQRATLGPSAR